MQDLSDLVESMNRGDEIDYRDSRQVLAIRSMLDTDDEEMGYEVLLRPTLRCNFRCSHCFLEQEELSLTDAAVDKVLKAFSMLKNDNIMCVISGGEPSIHPRFLDIIEGMGRFARRVMVQTNGSTMNQKILDDITLMDKIMFFVSFPSHSEEKYNHITQSSSFNRVVKGLREISTRAELILNHVLIRENHTDLIHLIDFVADVFDKKRTTLQISNIGTPPHDGQHEEYLVEYSVLKDKIREAIRYAEYKGVTLELTTSGDCSFPLCFYMDIDSSILSRKELLLASGERIAYGSYGKQFFKSEECRTCKYDRFCQGLLSAYARSFGSRDIRPIR